jgi:hypothetical protein
MAVGPQPVEVAPRSTAHIVRKQRHEQNAPAHQFRQWRRGAREIPIDEPVRLSTPIEHVAGIDAVVADDHARFGAAAEPPDGIARRLEILASVVEPAEQTSQGLERLIRLRRIATRVRFTWEIYQDLAPELVEAEDARRVAGAIRPRRSSPVSPSKALNVTWLRCTSNATTIPIETSSSSVDDTTPRDYHA